MFDVSLRPLIDPPLNKVGLWLSKAGISANAVTVSGFLIGLAAPPALYAQRYDIALLLLVVNRLADGLDGAIARHAGVSDFGGYLDIVLDFIFYSAFVFGFALAQPEHALFAAFLILSFIGTGGSFLAYAIIAAKRGECTEAQGKKSFFYLGGLTEGAETIAAFVLMCLFPDWFREIVMIFGVMCWITTISRIWMAKQAFGV